MARPPQKSESDTVLHPIDRIPRLSKGTWEWLESLDEDDRCTLDDLIRSYQRASLVGWIFKWLILTLGSVFAASVTFGEGIRKIYGWFGQ